VQERARNTLYSSAGLGLLAVLFVAIVVLANALLHGLRFDFTANKLYSLSPGTTEVIGEIQEPVDLYFYFSRGLAAKQAPEVLPYANRVQELLEELAARSKGKIRLQTIDPQPFSEDEDRAGEFGLDQLPLGSNGETLFFGLAGTNSTDGRSIINSFQSAREEFLEYDVAKLLHALSHPKKPLVGILSSISMQGDFNPSTGQMSEAWVVFSQIEQLFDVRQLSTDIDHLDKDIDVLMLVHPKNLAAKTLYAIDQYLMRGGKLLLFLDPYSGADTTAQDRNNPMGAAPAAHSSNLEPLLSKWGVRYEADKVVADLARGLDVRTSMTGQPVRHIGILGLKREDMAHKDVVSAALDSINASTAGFLAPITGARTHFEPLLSSSHEAEPLPAERFAFLADPSSLREGFKPTGQSYALAARITGPIKSAYPGGAPADAKSAGPPVATIPSTDAAHIIIVADTDLLTDYLWVQVRDIFGQRVAQPFAGNGDFVANALDNLSGSGALISIRGRAGFSRPFDKILELRHQADDRLRAKAAELESELKATERKLADLQVKRADQRTLALSADQQAEIKRFLAEKTRIRKELRETERGLDADIDRLENWLKIINIGLVPLLVSIAGMVYLARRRRFAQSVPA
jgi:ABC-type uncharacterized transport system involved in gliding motility auxiliary subunit